jgi:hypothetical protein
LQTHTTYLRVDRRQISFLRFVFEAYDGVAVLTTENPVLGIVSVHIAPGCEDVAEMIIDDLRTEIRIEPYGPAVQSP